MRTDLAGKLILFVPALSAASLFPVFSFPCLTLPSLHLCALTVTILLTAAPPEAALAFLLLLLARQHIFRWPLL
jgi:hypothetical protein